MGIEEQGSKNSAPAFSGLSIVFRFQLAFAALFLGAWLLAACGSADSQAVLVEEGAKVVIEVTPEALVVELEPAETLLGAADQLAAMLGTDSDNILVRIQSRDCSVCQIDASGVEYPDLPVDDAQSRLETNDKLWLVVQDLTCYYYYDGKTVSPLACGYEESMEETAE